MELNDCLSLADKKILIVDDEILILRGFSRALKACCSFAGQIVTVDTGSRAISEIRSTFYDLCFLDIKLPDMCGLDVMSKIRALSPKTIIAIMSANVMNEDQKKMITLSGITFFPKPLPLPEIRDFVTRCL